MAENKTKVFNVNGVDVKAIKMRDAKVKVGILRAVENESINGMAQLFKLLTDTNDAFVDELEPTDMEAVIIWATEA